MDIREKVFNYRSYTPIPLAIAVLLLAKPNGLSYSFGLLIALMGESLRMWGVRYAGSATRTTSGVGGEILVTNGPFAYVRNPLYLGNFILSFGLCLMAWAWMPWMLLIYLALFSLQYGLIISLEEEYLRKKFGPVYENYFNNVPRFFPRFTPYETSSTVPTSWIKAFHSERHTLANLIGFSLAVFLRWQLF